MLRKTWFITRPTRDALTSHDLLVKAMFEVASGKVWSGNRELHIALEQRLGELKIKADGISRDGSGGRTWAALARTFGYWYPDDVGKYGKVVMTPVAHALIKGDRVPQHRQKQILNYQIPNGYVNSGSFRPRYEHGFRVFPFRFMLRLLLDSRLEHFLHRDEVALFVLTTKSDAQFDEVIERIVYYRRLRQKDGVELANRSSLVQKIAQNCDHRARIDSQSVDYLSYVRDSALTHMILTEAINEEWFDRSERGALSLKREALVEAREVLSYFESRYPFDSRYRISEAAFARHYGLDLDRHKNTFRHGRSIQSRVAKRDMRVASAFEEIRACQPSTDVHRVVDQIAEKVGFSRRVVEESLARQGLLDIRFHGLNSEFIDGYLNAATDSTEWREFELKTMEILKTLGLTTFEPPPQTGDNQARIEIAVCCTSRPVGRSVGGIIDCKSGVEFRLGTKERDLMATTYIPSYANLPCPDGTEVPLKFFGYVVGKQFKGEKNFRLIAPKAISYAKSLKGIRGFVLNAPCMLYLLDQYLQGKIGIKQIFKVFISNRIFLSSVDIDRFVRI